VNLSARDLTDEDLVARVAATLAASGLPPHALWLEVTETALARDAEVAVKTLERLRGLGVRLALDDFGTGFAHLVQLRRFPVQAVKIDRSFVSGMSSDASDAAIVRSVISLGRELGLTIVAEGVETEAERARLVDLGCDLAQGFLFGRPQPADKVQLTAQPLLHAATRTDTDALGLRGIGAETALDAVASLAASLCEAPIALVCLFDGDGQRVKARVGVATDEQIRAHAGVPLVLSDGHTAGTLCVLDTRSRAFTTSQLDDLEAIGAQLVAQLDLQRDLKQARGDAQDRERRLDAVVAGSPNIICSITPEGIVDSLSGTTENLGIDPASYIGRSAMDIIHPDDLATALEELALAAKSLGVDRWLELRLRHASGDWVPFRVTSRTVEVHDGRRLIVLTATKLTGR
jgi:PAS domain S-box-containing protein